MFKITGLEKVQEDLDEAQRAMRDIDGELGAVNFDPHDPASIEAAIQSINHLVDERLGKYYSNPIIAPLAEQMKKMYRDQILKKGAEARLQS